MPDIHVHLHFDPYGKMKSPQASEVGREEMGDESDQDREDRLARYFTEGGTLTPEDREWLKGRGLLKY